MSVSMDAEAAILDDGEKWDGSTVHCLSDRWIGDLCFVPAVFLAADFCFLFALFLDAVPGVFPKSSCPSEREPGVSQGVAAGGRMVFLSACKVSGKKDI